MVKAELIDAYDIISSFILVYVAREIVEQTYLFGGRNLSILIWEFA